MALSVFKTACDLTTSGWVGSIPMHSRHRAAGTSLFSRMLTLILSLRSCVLPQAAARAGARAAALAAAIALLAAGAAQAQRPDSTRRITAAVSTRHDSAGKPPLSPRRAMIYAMLVPGSAQSTLGRHKAAAAFVLVEAITLSMIRESAADVHEAKRFLNDTVVVSYVDPQGNALPVPLIQQPHFDSTFVKSRRAHVEDWAALLVANHLFAGADAYVAANLWDVKAAHRHAPRARRRESSARRSNGERTATPPIGVFDSGIGGLTVAHEVIRQLPHESVIYFGDTARVPYGPKSPDTVRRYSREIAAFLSGEGVKGIVVACNTATAHALGTLRDELDMPVIGVVEPGARAAAAATRTGRIGVIGTAGTIKSGAYERAIRAIDSEFPHHGARLPAVRAARRGRVDRSRRHAARRARVLAPLVAAEIDTLVLGCTHYPLLKSLLERRARPRRPTHRQRRRDRRRNGAHARDRESQRARRRRAELSVHRVGRSAAVPTARPALSGWDDRGRGDPHSRLSRPSGGARRARR